MPPSKEIRVNFKRLALNRVKIVNQLRKRIKKCLKDLDATAVEQGKPSGTNDGPNNGSVSFINSFYHSFYSYQIL